MNPSPHPIPNPDPSLNPNFIPNPTLGDGAVTEAKNAKLVESLLLMKHELYDMRMEVAKKKDDAWRLLEELMPFEVSSQ